MVEPLILKVAIVAEAPSEVVVAVDEMIEAAEVAVVAEVASRARKAATSLPTPGLLPQSRKLIRGHAILLRTKPLPNPTMMKTPPKPPRRFPSARENDWSFITGNTRI